MNKEETTAEQLQKEVDYWTNQVKSLNANADKQQLIVDECEDKAIKAKDLFYEYKQLAQQLTCEVMGLQRALNLINKPCAWLLDNNSRHKYKPSRGS